MSMAWNVRSRIARLGLAVSMMGLLSVLAAAPVGAAGITLTTPYPAIAVAPGAKVTMDISITSSSSGRANLSLEGAPAEWNATLRGGGFAVDSVDLTAGTAAKVTLDATVPEAATGLAVVAGAPPAHPARDMPRSVTSRDAKERLMAGRFPSGRHV